MYVIRLSFAIGPHAALIGKGCKSVKSYGLVLWGGGRLVFPDKDRDGYSVTNGVTVN